MTSEKWVKLGLVAADPQFGTLQGKITDDSFLTNALEEKIVGLEQKLITTIDRGTPFELFDPIIFKIAQTPEGMPAIGTVALAKDTEATVVATDGDSIMMNPRNILWWAWIDDDNDQWRQIVATTISGIDIATGSDLDLGFDDEDGGILRFPRS